MSKEEISSLATQIQDNIHRLSALVELERQHLRCSLNEEMKDLTRQNDEIKSQIYMLNSQKKSICQEICDKYGHVYKSTVYHRKIFANGLGYISQGDIIQECVCCGKIVFTKLTPAPNDKEIDPMPPEMQEAIDSQISPIVEELKSCTLKLSDIQTKIESVQSRYYTDICKVYGHSHTLNQEGKSICPCCGNEVDENDISFLEYLAKLVKL